jgi:DNA-binding MarR family transcriptional regulator
MEDHIDRIRAQWRQAAPGIDTAGLEVIGRIERLSAELDQLLAAPFRAADIGDGDFNVLAALRRLGGAVRPSELADATIATSGAITKRLDRLQAKGLVDRLPDPDDGRSLRARLTERGRELADSLMRAHMTNEAALLGPLEPEEIAALAALLRRLALAVEDA